MVENIVERAIVPHNPAQAKVIEKEKYDLFAPIAKNGQVGMAKFDKDAFLIKDGEVYLHKDAIIKLVGSAFAKSLRGDWSSDGTNAFDLYLTSSTNDALSKVNIKLEAYLGILGPNTGSRNWLTIKLTATDEIGSYEAYERVLLPITRIQDLRFVQQDETDKYKLVLEYYDAVDTVTKAVEVDVPEYPIATDKKAGVVKVYQGSSTDIGIADGFIRVLKANEGHIAARGTIDTDYVLTASKTNAIVKAALTDKKKMTLSDGEKATARETIGAASTEDINGMSVAFTMEEGFNLILSLRNAKNEVISTHNIDLPLEEMVVSGKMSDDGKNVILTLKNGDTVEFSVATLVNGLAKQEEVDDLKEEVDDLKEKVKFTDTLDGNEADKAPSVRAVNNMHVAMSGNIIGYVDDTLSHHQTTLNERIDTIDTIQQAIVPEVDTLKSDVKILKQKVGEAYAVKYKRFDSTTGDAYPTVTVPEDSVRPYVMIDRIAPITEFGPVVGAEGTNFTNVSLTWPDDGLPTYNSEIYDVTLTLSGDGGFVCEINQKAVDEDRDGVTLCIDPIEIKKGECFGIALEFIGGTYYEDTSTETPVKNRNFYLNCSDKQLTFDLHTDVSRPTDRTEWFKATRDMTLEDLWVSHGKNEVGLFENFKFSLRIIRDFAYHVYLPSKIDIPDWSLPYDANYQLRTLAEENGIPLNVRTKGGFTNYIDMDTRSLVEYIRYDEALGGYEVINDGKQISVKHILTPQNSPQFVPLKVGGQLGFAAAAGSGYVPASNTKTTQSRIAYITNAYEEA